MQNSFDFSSNLQYTVIICLLHSSYKEIWACHSVPSLLLQGHTATRQLVSPSTHMNGVVPSSSSSSSSSSAATPLLLDAGRTTLSAMEASVRMTGTNHQGRTERSFISTIYLLSISTTVSWEVKDTTYQTSGLVHEGATLISSEKWRDWHDSLDI